MHEITFSLYIRVINKMWMNSTFRLPSHCQDYAYRKSLKYSNTCLLLSGLGKDYSTGKSISVQPSLTRLEISPNIHFTYKTVWSSPSLAMCASTHKRENDDIAPPLSTVDLDKGQFLFLSLNSFASGHSGSASLWVFGRHVSNSRQSRLLWKVCEIHSPPTTQEWQPFQGTPALISPGRNLQALFTKASASQVPAWLPAFFPSPPPLGSAPSIKGPSPLSFMFILSHPFQNCVWNSLFQVMRQLSLCSVFLGSPLMVRCYPVSRTRKFGLPELMGLLVSHFLAP